MKRTTFFVTLLTLLCHHAMAAEDVTCRAWKLKGQVMSVDDTEISMDRSEVERSLPGTSRFKFNVDDKTVFIDMALTSRQVRIQIPTGAIVNIVVQQNGAEIRNTEFWMARNTVMHEQFIGADKSLYKVFCYHRAD